MPERLNSDVGGGDRLGSPSVLDIKNHVDISAVFAFREVDTEDMKKEI